jgi:DNA-binding NarL/FixJ family response regulator
MNDRSSHNITIALVDDHNLFRKGLIKLIHLGDKESRYIIHFEAENGKDMMTKLVRKPFPDIIIMDIDMPDMDGYEAADWLQKYHPDIKILVVSMFESEEAIIRMVRLGVKGYLSKDIEVEDMHGALEAIAGNGYYYSEFAKEVIAHNVQNNTQAENTLQPHSVAWEKMSENEREFLKLACTELTYHQIANQMKLSPKTIDGYRESLFHKFSVKSRVGLAVYAIKHQLVKI